MLGRKRKPVDLSERLDALRAAIELADGRLDPDAVAFARNVVDKADGRLRHGTSHTLVALLGATGAGKSSITNALVGSEVATTGVRRPTTSATLACVWSSGPETGDLLDWLEIEHRHLVSGEATSGELDGLVLLDVPDHDSVEMSHRLEMERIAEHCDLMIWVTDPEKYADKALHHYLGSLPQHSAVVVLVLNKVDQLTEAEVDACRTDLQRLAAADGLVEPTVLPVSAATGVGIDDLRSAIGQAVRERAAMTQRLSADVAAAGAELTQSIGGDGEASVRDRAVKALTDELVDATGIDAVTDAVAAGTRRDAAAVMGWPFTRWVRRLRPHPLGRLHLGTGSSGRSSLPTASAAQTARAEGAVRTFVDDVSRDLVHPWPTVLRSAGTPDQAVLADRLDRAVADGVREHDGRTPRWWSAVGALQILLAVAAAAGAVWLTVLFALAWLQVPDPPTPEWRGWPVPTLLFGAGVILGLLVAAITGRIARLSARRAARRARAAAIERVETVAIELVVEPVRNELAGRNELLDALATTSP